MSLFTDTTNLAPLPSMPVERTGRFVLHRAGVRNVWQYDDVRLVFSGGRMLLRGKNGAGKSKAMEMLLPFLLDGDTRALDCVRKDRTSLYWLMTDGREPGNHIGYMWLELRAVDAEGNEEFRTLGCGVKASPATRKHTAWFFVTDKRVDDGIDVDDEAGMLNQDVFRAQLGSDEYFTTSASYARRVAKELFGIDDDARYRNLCHLLYELRRPSVGENIEAGQHTKVLTEALPPLDDDLIVDVARNFDDLTKIREDLARAEKTERALAEFLDSYRDYARGVLRHRAQAVVGAADGAAGARRQLKNAEDHAEQARSAADDAQDRVDDLDAQGRNAQGDLKVLMASPAYQHLQSINDRKQRVAAHHSAAKAAEGAVDLAREHEQQSAGAVTSTAANVDHEATQTRASRRDLEPLAAAARLDAGLLADPVLVTDASASAEQNVQVRRLDGAAETVSRTTPRRVDAGAVAVEVERHAAALAALVRNCDARSANLGVLIEEAKQADLVDRAASTAEQAAATAERQLEKATHAEANAAAAATAEDRDWRGQLRVWADAARAEHLDVDWSPVSAYAQATADPDGDADADIGDLLTAEDLDTLAAIVDDLLVPSRSRAEAAVTEAAIGKRDADEVLADLQGQLAEIEARTEKLPDTSRYRTVRRDSASGAPFYAAIEFVPHVDPTTAAGVEAALQASGLLDGWVTAGGVVRDATTEDVLLTPAPLGPGAATLTSVLAPALPPGSSVDPTAIGALLASIAFGPHPEASSWVDGQGRWGLGVAGGAWHKDRVEFVGVGARQAARERELADVRARIVDAEAHVAAAEEAVRAADEQRRALAQLRRDLPAARRLIDAVNKLHTLRDVTAEHRREFGELRTDAERARDSATRAQRELAENAIRLDLPHELSALTALRTALSGFTQRLRTARSEGARITRALVAHTEAVELWERTVDERRKLETEATRARDLYDDEAGQLATIEDAVGEDAQVVQAKIDAAQAALEESDGLLPGARKALTSAGEARALADDAVKRLHTTVAATDTAAHTAAASLGRILATPGLALAAFGPEEPALATPEAQSNIDAAARVRHLRAFAVRIGEVAAGGRDVSDGTMLKRYETLTSDSGMAAGYEATQDETDDAVKVFEIHDDTGRHPVAAVARRLTKEVADAQGRLTARQEEVFQRFLLGELGDHLRRQLLDADTLCAAMNRSLANVRTSHGLGVKLDWHLKEDAPSEAVDAIPMLREAPGIRGPEKNRRLGELLGSLIDAARDADPTASYEVHLHSALDYRNWHTFTIKVIDAANPGRERKLSNRLAVSQGEQRVLAYLALFSGAAAYFDSLKRRAPHAPRLILLDDAFAKVDEPTHGRLLALLVELDLDFVITSERVSGCVPGISLEVYECLRDARVRGVAIVHTHWDGQRAQLQVL